MAHLDEQGNPIVGEPLDDEHLPEGPIVVELGAGEVTHHVGQIPVVGRRAQVDPSEMAVQVELGVVRPEGPTQVEGDGDQPVAHRWDPWQPLLEQGPDGPVRVPFPVHRLVENHQSAHVHTHRRRLAGQERGVETPNRSMHRPPAIGPFGGRANSSPRELPIVNSLAVVSNVSSR